MVAFNLTTADASASGILDFELCEKFAGSRAFLKGCAGGLPRSVVFAFKVGEQQVARRREQTLRRRKNSQNGQRGDSIHELNKSLSLKRLSNFPVMTEWIDNSPKKPAMSVVHGHHFPRTRTNGLGTNRLGVFDD